MQPVEWWLLYEDFCILKGIKKSSTVSQSDAERLKKLMTLPEARPSKSIIK